MQKFALYTIGTALSIMSLGALGILAIVPIALLVSIKSHITNRRYPWVKR